MIPHVLDTPAVEAALEEVVLNREFQLASAASRTGGRKVLVYCVGRKTFTVKETNSKDLNTQSAEMAAVFYSER